jgi:hypothetical protein
MAICGMSVAYFYNTRRETGAFSMKKMTNKTTHFLGVIFVTLLASQPLALAKIKPQTPWRPRVQEASFIKGVAGDASLVTQSKITLSGDSNAIQFQEGKLVENIEFFKTPRCYLHFKKNTQGIQGIEAGTTLKVSKIDNIYSKGTVHVTFWFDHDSIVSDLACITNLGHTLTTDELKETLGSHFQVSFTKSIEKEALFNTAPQKNTPILTDNTPSGNPYSTRIILSDS